MTEQKTNIWHEPGDFPLEKFVIAVIDGEFYPFFEITYLRDTTYLSWDYVEKWCYLDDLLEQSNEVSRYKAALELARQEYKALVSSEIDSGKGELQIWMNRFDEIITLKPNKK